MEMMDRTKKANQVLLKELEENRKTQEMLIEEKKKQLKHEEIKMIEQLDQVIEEKKLQLGKIAEERRKKENDLDEISRMYDEMVRLTQEKEIADRLLHHEMEMTHLERREQEINERQRVRFEEENQVGAVGGQDSLDDMKRRSERLRELKEKN